MAGGHATSRSCSSGGPAARLRCRVVRQGGRRPGYVAKLFVRMAGGQATSRSCLSGWPPAPAQPRPFSPVPPLSSPHPPPGSSFLLRSRLLIVDYYSPPICLFRSYMCVLIRACIFLQYRFVVPISAQKIINSYYFPRDY